MKTDALQKVLSQFWGTELGELAENELQTLLDEIDYLKQKEYQLEEYVQTQSDVMRDMEEELRRERH